MVLSKLNPFSSSNDDDDSPLDKVNTTGGSSSDGKTAREKALEQEQQEDGQSQTAEVDTSPSDEYEGEYGDTEVDVPEIGDYHKDLIAPTGISPQVDLAKVGEDYTRTYFINGWPDNPNNGFLDEVLLQNDVQCDVSLHIRPFDSEKAINQLKNDAYKAKNYAEDSQGGGFLSGLSQKEDFEETLNIYQALRTTNTELFDVGLYLTVRGDSEKEVIQAGDDIVRSLRSSPALTKPEIAKYNQKLALQSVSPVMVDHLNYRTEMMGGAIAAMFPFSTKTIYEPNGVDYGRHAGNGSPVIVNRFESRDTGYNQLTIGDIGSGKSFSTKLNLLRTYASRDDVEIFIIDPLRGFESVNEVLGGTPITVGGSLTLNPMAISQTPEDLLRRQPDIDPYSTQLKKVMDFFEMFFNKQNLDLGQSRNVLQQAVEKAYAEKGITQEVETHSNENPTVQDVVEIIEQMVENPQDYSGLESEIHSEQLARHASSLAMSLQQFKKGKQYSNLGGNSQIDFDDNDVFYLDLSQQEGSGTFGIIMHILLSEVYEYSKKTDNKVMLAIDEAHYLMNDAKSLSYLTHVVRHSRHHNMSINFITQTIEEFFEHEESEKIAQNTSLKLFQKIESGIPEHIADVLDLSPQERYHIKNARPGNAERGFSEALIGVEDKGYYPLQVLPSDFEMEVLSFEPKNMRDTDLMDVANDIDGVQIPNRPNIEMLKKRLRNEDTDVAMVGDDDSDANDGDEEVELEFGSDERREQIMEEYGLDINEMSEDGAEDTTQGEDESDDAELESDAVDAERIIESDEDTSDETVAEDEIEEEETADDADESNDADNTKSLDDMSPEEVEEYLENLAEETSEESDESSQE